MNQAHLFQTPEISNAIVLSFTPATPRTVEPEAPSPTTTVPNDVEEVLLHLEDRRKSWEASVYRTSNQTLYGVLADCLAFSAPLPTPEATRNRANALNRLLAQRDCKVLGSSPLVTGVVKLVFGDVDRRRVSTYSQVLRSAQQEGIAPTDLATWIEGKGGIQQIRLQRSATYVSPQQRADRARDLLAQTAFVARVSSPELAQLAEVQHAGQDCVLLAQEQADGSFAIRAVVRHDAAINAARLGYFRAQQNLD